MIHFTSDTHFSHKNIITLSERPFADISHMHEVFISNWNSTVAPDDEVYHLGDFCFGGWDHWLKILDRLNGHITLILGNHDKIKNYSRISNRFKEISLYKEIEVEKQHICLFHYPITSWHWAGKGAWMLHGHCHFNLKAMENAKILDVGVDNPMCNYTPFSFNQIKKYMDKIEFKPIDHHVARNTIST